MTMKFKIYRYNPDTDAAPYMQDYDLDIEAGDKMLLDVKLEEAE
jgi:succinate dehydrogenase / fumarate reductase iron-sulfur subunit